VKLTFQNKQAQIEVVPSASALVIKVLKEPPRDRETKQNKTKNPTSNTVELSLLLYCQHCLTDMAPIFSQRTFWNH
jgi:hypothetical protein